MKTKKVFYTEIAYIAGIIILAFGTSLMEKADFGMSMIVAPAYILHVKLSELFSWYTFGVSEYIFQAFLLIVLSIVMRRFRLSYLFSFITAVIYGSMLDISMFIASHFPDGGFGIRTFYYIIGFLLCALGVALLFNTYISPEAYELFVKELAAKYGKEISKVKIIYDYSSCIISIIMSFIFFGLWHFVGIKLGTIICAIFNGWLIGLASKMLLSVFDFKDGLKLRKYFE